MLDDEVMAKAAGQHGLVTRAQVLAVGVGAGVLEGWLRRGHLVRVHRGVYRLPGAAESLRQRTLAAVLACGPGACADGRASCGLLRLEGFAMPGRPGVLVPRGRRVALRGAPVRATDVPEAHRATAEGIPCLRAARALLEVAPHVDEKRLRVGFDSARRARLTTLADMEATARCVRGHAGSAVVLAMLGSGVLQPESEGERNLRALLHDFSDLEWGVEGLVPGRRLDCLMRDALLVLEYDGRDHHVLPTDRDADGVRDLEVRSVRVDGVRLEVFRVTAGMIRDDPEGLRATLRRLREERRAEVAVLRLVARGLA